jgi:hypothetical protein
MRRLTSSSPWLNRMPRIPRVKSEARRPGISSSRIRPLTRSIHSCAADAPLGGRLKQNLKVRAIGAFEGRPSEDEAADGREDRLDLGLLSHQ